MFERLCLEAFQSGLSWLTILRKRENFRRAFGGFDIESGRRLRPGRRQPAAGRRRASCATGPRSRPPSPTPGPRSGCPDGLADGRLEVRRRPDASAGDAGRRARRPPRRLRRWPRTCASAGFRFTGPVTAYAMMQACGVVNDHLADCVMPLRIRQVQSDGVRVCCLPRLGRSIGRSHAFLLTGNYPAATFSVAEWRARCGLTVGTQTARPVECSTGHRARCR